MTRHPRISEMPESINVWQYVTEWLKLSSEDLKRLKSIQGVIRDRVGEYAETMAAEDLISQMEAVASRQYGLSSRLGLKGFVVAMGALTFGQGFNLLALSILTGDTLPKFVPAATFLGGVVASAYVDTLATRALTNWKKRRDLHAHRQQFQRQQQASQATQTGLTQMFYHSQLALVERVEQGNGLWHMPLHTIAACTLSIIEFLVTFYIVLWSASRGGALSALSKLPYGWVPMVAIAFLPVIITWAASLLQSEYFERPDYTRDLITQYERHITPSIDLSDETFYDWAHHRLYEDGRTNAHLEHVLGRHDQHLKNVLMARNFYSMRYHEQRIRQLQQDFKTEVHGLYARLQADLMALPERAPLPPLITDDRSDYEIHEQEVRRRSLRATWAEAEKPRLIARFYGDIGVLKADYTDEIRREYEKYRRAEAEYQKGYRQWKQLNQPEDDAA